MSRTIDDLRTLRPDLGFAVYAYEPGGEVTLEVLAEAGIFKFSAPTLDAAIEAAFPVEEEEDPDDVFS